MVNGFVCESIRRIRIERGLRIKDVAYLTGIPLGSYSCLETGRYRISLENLFRIVNALGIRIGQVWPQPRDGSWAGGRVTAEFIVKVLRDAESRRPRRIEMSDVLAVVESMLNVEAEDLSGRSRRRDVARARTLAAVLVKSIPHLTLVELARQLRRDVSSLSHCMRRFEWRMKRDPTLRELVEQSRFALEERMGR